MKTRLIAMLSMFCLVLVLFSGCTGNPDLAGGDFDSNPAISKGDTSKSEPAPSKFIINPLTGVKDLSADAQNMRPVAVMVNNVKTAWSVQSSLDKADIVYETYVEGGITRLMAVFSNIREPGDNKIGSMRSGRYSYADLAMGHGAIFVHAGLDNVYGKPRIQSIGLNNYDLLNVGANVAFRFKNGLAYEHTLYTTGNKLWAGLNKTNYKTTRNNTPWQSFRDEATPLKPSGGECLELTVPFSGSYNARFVYDAAKNTYLKFRGTLPHVDYTSKEQLTVKNVLVLFSTITTFPDGKHMKTDLTSGTGYYVSNGGYQQINWSKGDASNGLKITTATGASLSYNAGNTWVCLTNKTEQGNVKFSK